MTYGLAATIREAMTPPRPPIQVAHPDPVVQTYTRQGQLCRMSDCLHTVEPGRFLNIFRNTLCPIHQDDLDKALEVAYDEHSQRRTQEDDR